VKQIKETLRFSWYSEAKSLKTLGFIDIFVTFFLVFLGFLVFSGFPIFFLNPGGSTCRLEEFRKIKKNKKKQENQEKTRKT
jgi:D-alanyl-lipoteichoic acid acyltransferase DltB (MBOAT superfamily)